MARTSPPSAPASASTSGPSEPHHEGEAPLDVLLTDAGSGPLRRFVPATAGVKLAVKLARRPRTVAGRGAGVVGELGRIARGSSTVMPPKGDRRFKDPAWTGNPALSRLAQAYLLAGQTIDGLIADADLEWRDERRVRFAADNLVSALAPTNFPLTNPTALKTAVDTGGQNFVKGAGQLVGDLRRPPRIPTMVDGSAFDVGRNIAVSPGAVVLRTPVFELLQYEPTTERVREVPLLLTPPMINKYYVADLAPGRSMIEYFVGSGQQAYAISWRNPDERHAEWNLDTYAGAVGEALDAVEAITGTDRTHVLGLCAGGITLSTLVSHLFATGRGGRIAGLTLGVTVIDNEHAGTAASLVDRGTADAALADSSRRGYLDGRALAGVFAWLRPNDLVWNYWVNNYLLGKDPPAFDILYWNADTTNMPAGLHRDFVEIALSNDFVHPGRRSVLGTPVDLSKIEADTYLVAGISDHITPWESCYHTTRLLGSDVRFVLSTSGHIAAMVNPPGNEKASYRVGMTNPSDPEQWLRAATTRQGSWWDDYVAWLRERSGEERPAPAELGSNELRPLAPAPGTYVLGAPADVGS